jgi:hypothetical protein
LGADTSGQREVGRECKKVNMVHILCSHEYKQKNVTWKQFFKSGKKGIKENGGEGEFDYDIVDKL